MNTMTALALVIGPRFLPLPIASLFDMALRLPSKAHHQKANHRDFDERLASAQSEWVFTTG
jgi:hypothetical protein